MHKTAGRRAPMRGARDCHVACTARSLARPRAAAIATGGRGMCSGSTFVAAGLAPAAQTSTVPTPRPAVTAAIRPDQHPTKQAGALTRAFVAR